MKFYLSSYKLGDQAEKLKNLIPNNKIGYINNARDSDTDLERKKKSDSENISLLRNLGIEVEEINLKHFFGKKEELKKKITELAAIFISGGNVFVLRQAMKISGLDEILKEFKNKSDFLYSGYSAAGCVLAPTLYPYKIVDDPKLNPYPEIQRVIMEGLGLVDFNFMPHFNSDHPESQAIAQEIEYCKENNLAYKAIKDGEVIIIDP